MKYQFFLTLFCLFVQFTAFSQIPDYRIYHSYINKAEELFFIEGKADSSLYYYKRAFTNFEFVFAKDALNAAQIAFFSQKPFREFLLKGFENGLKLSHLVSVRIFNPVYNRLLNDTTLQNAYSVCRAKYIKRLELDYLSYVYEKALKDQVDKNKTDYDAIKTANLEEWRTRIKLKGFPGDKIVGLDDKTIFSETGNPAKDLDQLETKYGNTLGYLTTDDEILSSKFIMIMLVHNQCSFQELQTTFAALITKGEIHPREVGLLYDNQFRTGVNSTYYRCTIPRASNGLFYLNMFCKYDQLVCSPEQADNLRKKWFIVPLSVDKVKKEYEQKYGFRLFWGFWNCM